MMRLMNGRLHNIVRSPLMRNSYLHNGEPSNRQNKKESKKRGDSGDLSDRFPRTVLFDESSETYRCLCSCFHVKTGAYFIAVLEIFLVFVFFTNALLVRLQQRPDLDPSASGSMWRSRNYVRIAFTVESAALAVALAAIFLMLFGLARNYDKLLIPHLIIQAFSVFCFVLLLISAIIAFFTDHAFFYRFLNAAPFQEFPGQMTVALSAETFARIYAVVLLYAVVLALEIWFLRVIYNCNRYLNERGKYMAYCRAYSTPMKTLTSAR